MNLNEVIRHIQEEYSLSAETRNALHGATAGHPWCAGKTLDQRKQEAQFAVGGKISNEDFERIQKAVAETRPMNHLRNMFQARGGRP